MSGVELTEAVEVGAREYDPWASPIGEQEAARFVARRIIIAALPFIEAQVREAVAAEIVRLHPKVKVYELADECDHDPDAPGYDDDHRENADGYVLCYLTRLDDICETCSDVDDDSAWPCPTLTALGVTA